ncbi:MAG: DNA-directed RNA polymerase subunit alpha C-terminal domain-containing protein [Thermoguttaceae bacterium]|jgi:DNA-directed RNA polymerase subunit alpha|nr:DNA-directed RNA polymerase subunit alpha C-terminal domain-containing protein [Thermoguttaceae bacterium]
MPEAEVFDVKQVVLVDGSFGPREITRLEQAIAHDHGSFRTLRDAVSELQKRENPSPACFVRLGVCLYLLGRYYAAIEALQKGDGGALAHFYLAKAYLARHFFDEAVASWEAANKAGYNSDACALGKAETLRYAGNPQAAIEVLDSLSGAVEQTADYLSQRAATVAALGGNPSEVVALYERAVEADRDHAGALFGLAVENDRYGNDTAAMEFYKRAADRFPAHVGSLLNLGILYEDYEQYDQAAQCFQRILDAFPDHSRARLFLKDTQASSDQYYDEDAQKKRDRMSQVLSIPVTDFELSVRSRNCLQKMGIMTLGDLCRCTEAELLASKNFGETSLVEIRDMLYARGLHLGQFAPERHVADAFEPEALSPEDQAVLNKPIADLNLSVRARKCLIKLGISTLSELIRRTGDDLLECKNFGVTSLNEVRDKLAVLGLKLRGE